MKVLLTWLFMLMFEFNIQPFLLEDKQGLYRASFTSHLKFIASATSSFIPLNIHLNT